MTEREVFNWSYPSPLSWLIGGSAFFIVGGFFLSRVLSWLGILLIAVGFGVIVLSCIAETRYTIYCLPDDFTVTTKKRFRKAHRSTYRWGDVHETRYSEISMGGGSSTAVMRYFAVRTSNARAFEVSTHQRGDFGGLIATFNRMTPHMPYIWRPQGPGSTRLWRYGFDRYRRVPRETVAAATSRSARGVPPFPWVPSGQDEGAGG